MRVKKFCLHVLLFGALVLCACDLQPKIASIPDSVGMFIESRYPALLADPNEQPEIYNSAVTDYGVYASPELYGSANIDDYVLYASVDDYVLVPDTNETNKESGIAQDIVSNETEKETTEEIPDTEEVPEETFSEYLVVPEYGGNTVIDEIKEVVPKKESEKKPETPIENKVLDKDEIIVERGDTLYSLARKHNTTVAELSKINDLKEPYRLSVGQKLKIRAPEIKKAEKPMPNVISEEKVKQIKEVKKETKVVKDTVKPTASTRVDLQEITVETGDTLYSLSRKYEIPVNDLAVMNKLSVPFGLKVGQKLKVPKLDTVQTRTATAAKKNVVQKTNTKDVAKKANVKSVEKKTSVKQKAQSKQQQKIQQKTVSKPIEQKPQQKITARSSSKFSWPVRGNILSGYGPKKGGLVNDGINISADFGTTVKAAENGIVAYAGNEVKGMGNLIIIQHSDGWMTVYAHLNSMSVKRGARVSVGQAIGKIGKTGKVDKPQLHFEIRKGTKSYNPTLYLKK